MSMLALGLLFGIVTLVVMFSGMPIAFSLGSVAVAFMFFFMPAASLDTVTQNVYEEMASITLLSIPLFILKGAAIGKSRGRARSLSRAARVDEQGPRRAGHRQCLRVRVVCRDGRVQPRHLLGYRQRRHPGNADARVFARVCRGHLAAGGTLGILLPPSITMILYAVAAEQSLGRLFLAGIGPGVLLVGLFALYAVYRYRKEHRAAIKAYAAHGTESAYLDETRYSMREKFEMLPRVVPFVVLLIGVMVALYGGYATPSETAGLGAVLALALIAIVYGIWRPRDLEPILASALKESTMLMFIIGMSLLFSYVMSYLHLSQAAAAWIVSLHLTKWLLLATILLLVVVLGSSCRRYRSS